MRTHAPVLLCELKCGRAREGLRRGCWWTRGGPCLPREVGRSPAPCQLCLAPQGLRTQGTHPYPRGHSGWSHPGEGRCGCWGLGWLPRCRCWVAPVTRELCAGVSNQLMVLEVFTARQEDSTGRGHPRPWPCGFRGGEAGRRCSGRYPPSGVQRRHH